MLGGSAVSPAAGFPLDIRELRVSAMSVDLFHLKGVVSKVLYPLNAWAVMSLVGLAACCLRPLRRIGMMSVIMATLWLFMTSMPAVGFILLRSLELRAGPGPDVEALAARGVTDVVVIGNIAEGVKIWRGLPGSRLIVSSGSYAHTMAGKAREMGVPDASMVVEAKARDTQEQAAQLRQLLQGRPFVLSTWALHMPRALMTFRWFGMDPIPAPSNYVAVSFRNPESYWPSHQGMHLSQLAVKEYCGTAWILIRSTLSRPAPDQQG